jgi:hypothetical protein
MLFIFRYKPIVYVNFVSIWSRLERYGYLGRGKADKRIVYASGKELVAAKYTQCACHKGPMGSIEFKLPFGIF